MYKEGVGDVNFLHVRRVNATQFAQNGITVFRGPAAGYIRNVVITDTYTFMNPGMHQDAADSMHVGGRCRAGLMMVAAVSA